MFEGKYNSAPCPKDTMSHRLLAPFISARGYPIFGLTLSPNKKAFPLEIEQEHKNFLAEGFYYLNNNV